MMFDEAMDDSHKCDEFGSQLIKSS